MNTSDSVRNDLQQVGYTISPVLRQEVVNDLFAFYLTQEQQGLKGFQPTLLKPRSTERQAVSEGICSRLQSYIQTHLPGYRMLYGSFMVKMPGEESFMKLHQDWSYVKEPEHHSLALWLPLVDLNDSNGALHVVPRSHLFKNYWRGPGVFCPFAEHSDYICEHWGKPLFLEKGQPVVWDHRLLHFSPSNLSDEPRVAVTVILVPEGVSVLHFFKPEENDIVHEFEVDSDFYYTYEIGEMPVNKVILRRQFNHREPTFSKEKIAEVLKERTFLPNILKFLGVKSRKA